jgi:hypothetical protein
MKDRLNIRMDKLLLFLALVLLITAQNINVNMASPTLECRAGSVKCNGICDKPKHI